VAWGYVDGKYGWIADGSAPTGPTAQSIPTSAAGPAAPVRDGRAKQVSNVGTNGSDARFHVGPNSGLTRVNGGWMDSAGSVFDDNGLWTGQGPNPTRVVPGLPPANQSEDYNVYTGEVKGGGGGGSALAGMGAGVSDPYVNQMKSFLQSQSAADLANTKAAIQKALIAFGLVPATGFDDKLGALDEATKNLIKQNTDSGISYYARLLEQKKDNLRSATSRLSSSGLRRSGAKGYKLRRAQLDADRTFQDSLSELMGQIGNMYSGYAGNEANRQMQLLQAIQNAQGNFWTGAGSSVSAPGGAPSPSFTPAWQGTWAEGIDTGGYVPGSGVITDYGSNQPTYNLGNGVVAF
jgi:hypothetical protein